MGFSKNLKALLYAWVGRLYRIQVARGNIADAWTGEYGRRRIVEGILQEDALLQLPVLADAFNQWMKRLKTLFRCVRVIVRCPSKRFCIETIGPAQAAKVFLFVCRRLSPCLPDENRTNDPLPDPNGDDHVCQPGMAAVDKRTACL